MAKYHEHGGDYNHDGTKFCAVALIRQFKFEAYLPGESARDASFCRLHIDDQLYCQPSSCLVEPKLHASKPTEFSVVSDMADTAAAIELSFN